MMEKIQERIREMDRMVEDYKIFNEKKAARLLEAKGKEGFVWMYESGPNDHWEGWYDLRHAHYVVEHKMKMNDVQFHQPHLVVDKLEKLLLNSLELMKVFQGDFRGENLKFVLLDEFSVAIAGKCDNNGTCYAFCTSEEVASELPNDFGEWELYDCIPIKGHFKSPAANSNP